MTVPQALDGPLLIPGKGVFGQSMERDDRVGAQLAEDMPGPYTTILMRGDILSRSAPNLADHILRQNPELVIRPPDPCAGY